MQVLALQLGLMSNGEVQSSDGNDHVMVTPSTEWMQPMPTINGAVQQLSPSIQAISLNNGNNVYGNQVAHQSSVINLLEWVTREAEYRALASETRQGVSKPKPQMPQQATMRPQTPPRQHLNRWEPRPTTTHGRTCVVTNSTNRRCWPACNDDKHNVWECATFKDMSIAQRSVLAKNERLCYGCLNKGHMVTQCQWQITCNRDGCKEVHHQMLHADSTSTTASEPAQPVPKHTTWKPKPTPRRRRNNPTVGLTVTSHNPCEEVANSMEGEQDAFTVAHAISTTIGLRTVPV